MKATNCPSIAGQIQTILEKNSKPLRKCYKVTKNSVELYILYTKQKTLICFSTSTWQPRLKLASRDRASFHTVYSDWILNSPLATAHHHLRRLIPPANRSIKKYVITIRKLAHRRVDSNERKIIHTLEQEMNFCHPSQCPMPPIASIALHFRKTQPPLPQKLEWKIHPTLWQLSAFLARVHWVKKLRDLGKENFRCRKMEKSLIPGTSACSFLLCGKVAPKCRKSVLTVCVCEDRLRSISPDR